MCVCVRARVCACVRVCVNEKDRVWVLYECAGKCVVIMVTIFLFSSMQEVRNRRLEISTSQIYNAFFHFIFSTTIAGVAGILFLLVSVCVCVRKREIGEGSAQWFHFYTAHRIIPQF